MTSRLKIKVETNLNICKSFWNEFSKNISIFDIWDYRVCFFDPKYQEVHFIVGSENNKNVFLLPLWKKKSEGLFEWFGGEFFENNKIMLVDDKYADSMISSIPSKAWLACTEKKFCDFTQTSTTSESFFLDLAKYNHSFEAYFAGFNKKHRKNLLRDLKIVSEQGIEVSRNDMSDFDRLIELSIKRFGSDSFLSEAHFTAGFRKMLELAKSRGELELLSLKINGITEASEAAIFYNGTYTVLLGGSNLEINNIGKLLIVRHIENAIKNHATIVDFLADDCGWKTMWHMEKKTWCDFEKD